MKVYNVIIKKAGIQDAEVLTRVQKSAFNDDSQKYQGREKGEPEGYNLENWQLKMMNIQITLEKVKLRLYCTPFKKVK